MHLTVSLLTFWLNSFSISLANLCEQCRSLILCTLVSVTLDSSHISGTMGDKNYLRLVESLDILILELDGIGVDGLDSVRAARRAAVKQLQQAIEMLEFRASTKAETNALSDSGSNSVEQAATSPSIKDDV